MSEATEKGSSLNDIFDDDATIASDNFDYIECGENYVCINEDYALYGMCLKCGSLNNIATCTHCNVNFIVEEGINIDEPAYYTNCYKKLFEEY